ncbi:MAG: hypothetical protein HQK50_06510 [Oligoflexia bacterium]|nr:hypothetical protein [Oligoflexia bacterium]MBF0365204.1 hypothetical protein [Oligoflexia bacterium]
MNIEKLLTDVFNPQANDVAVVLCDIPHTNIEDNSKWYERRIMAQEWREAFISLSQKIGFKVLPLIEFPASGAHSKNVPMELGTPRSIDSAFAQSTLAVALTEFSITPLLMNYSKQRKNFRSASLPIVEKRMEKTALAADYKEVYRRCLVVEELMKNIKGANVKFSTGHDCYFDLRFRTVRKDSGRLHQGDSPEFPFMNLPSGEVYMVPYEGEKDCKSETAGLIPAFINNESVVLKIAANKIVEVSDFETSAENCRNLFAQDPARRNIAEFAIGCNPWAVVTGNILEDEKAGFHWAFGRSEHIGGIIKPSDFISSENVLHVDVVYAKDSKYQVDFLEFIYDDNSKKNIIENREYLIF